MSSIHGCILSLYFTYLPWKLHYILFIFKKKNSLESPTLQRNYKPEEFIRIKKDKMLMRAEIDIDRERLTNITRHVKIQVFPLHASIYGFIYCFFILFIFSNLRVYFVATQLSTFIKSTIFFFNLLLTRISCFLEQQAPGGQRGQRSR